LKKISSISLYWKCQIIGWLVCCLYWVFSTPAKGYNYPQAGFDFIGDFSICILLTHGYRNFALSKGWDKLNLKSLVPRIIPAAFLLGISFMILIALKLYVVRLLSVSSFSISFSEFFKSSWLTLFVTGIRLMSIWVLAYHLYHYAQREINIAKENARLSLIIKEAQLNNLSAQLNPHFLFNSLNTIKYLVTENPESARRAVDLLSSVLRNSLYTTDVKLISVREELNLVKDYLELEKMRFEERLQLSIQIPNELLEILIPPLSIQALVENAIKHGIDKKKDGGLIEVKAEMTDSFLIITVQNPGKLFSEKNSIGLGLNNLKERLLLQFNEKASFTIEELQNEKVLTTISIPVS
jgi:sensor histidine kinase YesM